MLICVISPVLVYCYLKIRAHDTLNYYQADMLVMPGNPTYESNCNKDYLMNNIKLMLHNTKETDFLGRSN